MQVAGASGAGASLSWLVPEGAVLCARAEGVGLRARSDGAVLCARSEGAARSEEVCAGAPVACDEDSSFPVQTELRATLDHEVAMCLGHGAHPQRVGEFRDGRLAAHQALHMLEASGSFSGSSTTWKIPILRGERSMPVFPVGTVGTIAHTRGVRAALVAWGRGYRSLGLDVEHAVPLPSGVAGVVLRDDEPYGGIQAPGAGAERSDSPRGRGEVPFDTVVFSCKEAIYKAWFPLARRFLDFPEVRVELREHTARAGASGMAEPLGGRWGTYRAAIVVPDAPIGEIEGRWLVADGLIWATAAVPAELG